MGRPRQNQGSYDGPVWAVPLVLHVKAPSWREALRRASDLCTELVEGTGVDASDLWVRSFIIDQEDDASGHRVTIREHHATA
jgi:hypothetical protein